MDSVTGNHPLFVSRYDGHMAFANTIALQRAGITKNTKDPNGGEIVRDSSGEPTGILKDEAMNLMYKVIPDPGCVRLNTVASPSSGGTVTPGATNTVTPLATAYMPSGKTMLHSTGS